MDESPGRRVLTMRIFFDDIDHLPKALRAVGLKMTMDWNGNYRHGWKCKEVGSLYGFEAKIEELEVLSRPRPNDYPAIVKQLVQDP